MTLRLISAQVSAQIRCSDRNLIMPATTGLALLNDVVMLPEHIAAGAA